MRRWCVSFVLMFSALVLGGFPHLEAQVNRAAYLQVFDARPTPVAPLALDQAVTLVFNRRVDCQDAEAAFHWAPAIDGDLTCDEFSLTFSPRSGYQRETTYTFMLMPPLYAKDGAILVDPYQVSYLTVGYLQVAEVLPSQEAGPVPTDSAITVVFDRPVVPLTTSMDVEDLPQPIRLSPSVAGAGEWINSAIYEFKPAAPLKSDSRYTAIIDEDLTAIDGAVLQSAYSWTFQTAAPSLVSIDPPPGTPDLALDPMLQLRFNQALDRVDIERAFYLRALPDADGADVSGVFTWADDGMGVAFAPSESLQLDSVYEAGFSAELLPDLRFSNLPGGSWTYNTVPPPAITTTEPVDGAETTDRGGFSLFFASMMNIESLPDRITIEPEPELRPRYYFSEWSKRYTVSFDAEPSTSYTIRIAPGMEDIYGNAISETLTFSYTTSPRSPELGLNVPGPVGFYNAYRPRTELYLYHRGVEYVDLELSHVPLTDFIGRLTQEEHYDPATSFDPAEDQLIRRWRIGSNTPENATRYELLSLSDEDAATEAACAGALPTRLRSGESARVSTTTTPLRARLTPATGAVMQLLYAGYELAVTAGPSCLDGVNWWQVALQDGRSAWVAEGIGDEYFLEPGAEERDGSGLEPGIYFLEANSPGLERFAWQNKHFLNVATAVVTVKQATDRLTIWAVDVESGEPIREEGIAVYGGNGALVGGGTTDEDGIAIVDIPYTRDLYSPFVVALSAEDHFGIGYTSWSDGAEPWNFGYRFSWSPRAYQTYLYTDRPVYRTGQPVYFRGIVRSKDDVVYMPVPYQTAPVTIRDAQGEIVFQRDLPLNDFGSFSGKFDIAQEASLGAYTLEVSLPQEDDFIQEGDAITFLVAEYRPPEYQVTLATDSPEILQGASATFDLEGQYFFGGPVSDAAAEYVVYARPYEFNYTGDGRYDFVDRDIYELGGEGYDLNRVIAEGSLFTDSDGTASFALVGDLSGEARSQQWQVEAAIRDEAGQAIYDSASLIAHQAMLYIGARAANTVSVAGEDSRIDLIAVDWDSQPIADQPIDIQIVERRWISLQEQDPATGAIAWTWDVEEIPVAAGNATTADDGRTSFVYRPPNGGIYKIIVSTRDAAGFQARAATYAWVSGADYVSWRQENNNTIQLVPESTNYSVGDRAKILIASPFQGRAEALISIERGDVLSTERVSLNSNSQIYEFEILPRYAPNIFVNVFLVKPRDANHETVSWRAGMTQLLVDIDQKALNIDISADTDVAAPQDYIEYRLRVTDYRGEPVTAEVGIGVTDLAALSVGERNSEPILEFFYGPQELSVRSSSSLIVSAEAFTASVSERKGGGGGIFESGIVDLRGEFIDTAYWNPSVITDANGEAVVEARLPDNLTTWRLDARALTAGRDGRLLVGEKTFDLISTRPLLIRPVTPRFFVVGDSAQLAAVVNNNTGQDISAIVSLESFSGLELSASVDQVQTVTIPASGRQRVTWTAGVADVASVAPVFVARSVDGAFADASISPVSSDDEGRLPVYRYDVRETVGAAGQLAEAGSRSEAVRLPRGFDAAVGRIDIRLDKSLAGLTNQSLTFLDAETRRFSECNSAVVNRFLPNIVSYRALKELALSRPTLENKLDELASDGLQTLYGRQLANGGWSWCAYPEADAMTSAYALIGLAVAETQGYPVDANVIRRAQRYLREQLIRPSLEIEQWQLNRQAFLLYALAESGAPDIARSTTLYESRDRLNLDATAFLALTLHRINPADHLRLDALTQLMLNRAVLRASGAFFEETYEDRWNWSTDIRSTALALTALLKLRPESDLLPNIVRRLVTARDGNGYWPSSQENTWSIIALTDWMLFSGELKPDYVYSVAVNDAELLRDLAMPENALVADAISIDLADLKERESNIVEFQRDEGAGVLYYTAHLNLDVPVDRVEAYSQGIEVSRTYSLPEDESGSPVTGASIGGTVQGHLRITVPNTLRYVVIEDFFPAGAEAVNPDLAISPQLGAMPRSQRLDPREQGWGWWHFDHIEFHDERAVIYASALPPGVYEFIYTIRPTVVGEFNVIPPVAQALYFPEVYGRGDGARFTVAK